MRKHIDFQEKAGFVLIMVLVMSCSVLRERKVLKMDSVQLTSSLHSMKWDLDSLSTGFHSLTLFDSTNAEYIAEIFPVGIFSFSVQDGFKGTAKNIVMRGSTKRNFQIKDSLENAFHLKSSGQLKDQNKTKLSVASKAIEKPGSDLSWIAIPVLLTLLVMGLLKSNLF